MVSPLWYHHAKRYWGYLPNPPKGYIPENIRSALTRERLGEARSEWPQTLDMVHVHAPCAHASSSTIIQRSPSQCRDWQVSAYPRQALFHTAQIIPYSTERYVVVYAPEGGTLSATVSATYNSKILTAAKKDPVTIVKCRDFTIDKGFERVEVLSFVIAGAIALISGLSLLYAKNPTFGAMADYLGLFLWGIGIDQGKNLAQSLQMTAPPAKPT